MVKKSKSKSKLITTKYNFIQLLSEYEKLGLTIKTINSINFIYRDYEKYFFTKNLKSNIFCISKKSNIFPKEFFELSSIMKYIKNQKNNAISTKVKKRNILKKVFSELINGKIKRKNMTKNKTCNKKIFGNINLRDFIKLMSGIFKKNDINLILVIQLALELGLSLTQIIKLKFSHIKKNFSNILFKENKTQIYKALSIYSASLLKLRALEGDKKNDDFIIFKEFKNLKRDMRNRICIEKIRRLINNISDINISYKNKIFNLLKKERPRLKFNSISIDEKNIFFGNLFEKIYFSGNNTKISDNNINKDVNENDVLLNSSNFNNNLGVEKLTEYDGDVKDEFIPNITEFNLDSFESQIPYNKANFELLFKY